MEIWQMGCNFSYKLVLAPPPEIRLNRVKLKMRITYLKNCLSTFKFFLASFFTLSFVHFESSTNLKKI